MRKIDKNKTIFQRCSQTISFERVILEKLEERAKKENSTVSNIVNFLCRKYVLNNENYHKEMARHHFLEYQKHKYLSDEARIKVEVRNAR